jgi:hypothetical protein
MKKNTLLGLALITIALSPPVSSAATDSQYPYKCRSSQHP